MTLRGHVSCQLASGALMRIRMTWSDATKTPQSGAVLQFWCCGETRWGALGTQGTCDYKLVTGDPAIIIRYSRRIISGEKMKSPDLITVSQSRVLRRYCLHSSNTCSDIIGSRSWCLTIKQKGSAKSRRDWPMEADLNEAPRFRHLLDHLADEIGAIVCLIVEVIMLVTWSANERPVSRSRDRSWPMR